MTTTKPQKGSSGRKETATTLSESFVEETVVIRDRGPLLDTTVGGECLCVPNTVKLSDLFINSLFWLLRREGTPPPTPK